MGVYLACLVQLCDVSSDRYLRSRRGDHDAGCDRLSATAVCRDPSSWRCTVRLQCWSRLCDAHAHGSSTFLVFLIGALVGIAVAAQIVVSLPQAALQAVLACFILYTVWGPKLAKQKVPAAGFIGVGAVTSFATMFVGATGPLLAALLPPDKYGKMVTVATHGACMTVQHGLKVVAFGIVGFAFVEWMPLIAAMIATGFLGTTTGKKVLDWMPERAFAIGFKTVLTVLAARLLWMGVSSLIGR